LLNELEQYSPELLDKERLLGSHQVRHARRGDDAQLKKELPQNVDHVMISSVAGTGLDELKDKLWKKLHGTFPAITWTEY
jgi:GTP-binding protein